MKNRLNNILIGILWLLAVTLAACFWFNVRFGFNIFLVQHWQYLAYMQASKQPIEPSFYISIVITIVIAVFGLYKLLQPRFHHIVLPVMDTKKTPQPPATTPEPITQPVETVEKDVPAPVSNTSEPGLTRPPRLNIPTISTVHTPPRVPLSSNTPQPRINPETEYADIREIFSAAGYTYKGSPRVKNIQTSILAIGTDEVLWLGATGIKTPDMKKIVDTLNSVFADTLEDIEINVNAFIIAAPDATENNDNSIMHFTTVDDLRAYIMANPNTPLDADETENFDAYSAYIGTVIDYIGKI